MFRLSLFRCLFLLFAILAISSCGGGGSSSGGGTGGGVNTSINVSSNALDFYIRTGTGSQSQTVTVNYTGDGVVIGTPPNDPNLPAWLSVNVVGPQTSNPLTVSVTVTSNITGYPGTPDTYTATLRFVTGRLDGSNISYVDVPVTFNLYSAVSVNTDPRTVSLYKSISSGTNSGYLLINAGNTPWTAQSNQPWLQLNQTSGKSSAQLGYSVDVAQLTVGEANAVITVHDEYENMDFIVPVTAFIQPNKLSISQQNMAFSSMPSRGQLTANAQINDLAVGKVQWQATTTSTWLTLDQSSTVTPATLSVTANPSTLSSGMHYGSIKLSSTDQSVTSDETIYVGFYVSDADPLSTTSAALPALPVNTVQDPLGPYVYISYGTNSIDIYNIYTATLVSTITFPDGTEQLTSMAVSDDGESLFIYNMTNETIIKYALKTSLVADTFINAGAYLTDVRFSRVKGYPLLILGNGSIMDPQTGATYATYTGQAYIAIQNNHTRFIATHYNYNWGHTLNEITLYAIPDINISVSEIDAETANETVRRCDDAVSPAGNKFYIVCDTDTFVNSYVIEYDNLTVIPQNIINLGETSSNPADNIELLSDTLAVVGMNTKTTTTTTTRATEISLFDLTTQLQTPVTLDSTAQNLFLLWREMRISSDRRRLTAIHYNQATPVSNVISFTDLP